LFKSWVIAATPYPVQIYFFLTDYVNIYITNKFLIEKLKASYLLEFYSDKDKIWDKETGVIANENTKLYKGILFQFKEITPKNIPNFWILNIKIKPHYYFNNNEHNANDFKASESIIVIKEFIETFNLTLVECKEMKVNGIEYGLNFLLHFNRINYGKEFINFLGFHVTNSFVNDQDLKYSKKAFSFNRKGKANKYLQIKCYAKGVQCPEYTHKDTIRFEVKSNESKYIKSKIEVNTIDDLLKPKVYILMQKDIIHHIEKVLVCDMNAETKKLTKREQNQLNKYLNPLTWEGAKQVSRNEFANRKKRYSKILDKTGFNIHRKFKEKAIKKLNYLVDFKIEKGAYSKPQKENEKGAYSTISKLGICTFDKLNTHPTKTHEKCIITGVKLYGKDIHSKYIRTSTLRYLKENDENTFAEVCNLLLNKSNPYHTKYERGIIKHLAKQVRNSYYNPRPIKNIGYNAKMYTNQYELRLWGD
jgi:hypothetical protein